jgi:adenine-specific DNA-methyltransferase
MATRRTPEITASDLAELPKEDLITLVERALGGSVSVTFSGKADAARVARKVRPRVLRQVKKLSVGPPEAQAENSLIEGDNLQAMATLYRERGHVDLILTDPPYNTGNDFRYNDKWESDPNDPGLGEFVSPDDGARHTKWMRFMYPRLQMMKSMLKPSGVLAICIDHRELFHLGQMLDEIFGESNRLAIVNWQKSYSPRGDKKHVSTATEYVLVYARNETKAKTSLEERTAVMDARYKSRDGDRPWKGGDLGGPGAKTHQKMVYGIQSPFTGEIHYPPIGSCWRPEQRQVLDWMNLWGCEYVLRDLDDAEERARIIGLDSNEIQASKGVVVKGSLARSKSAAGKILKVGPWPPIYFGVKGSGRPQLKVYLEAVKQGKVPTTYWANVDFDPPFDLEATSWPHEQSGHSQTGQDELTAIVGTGHDFDTVKPLRLFEKIIQLWCPSDGMVLDPFAGSGTTGHAVLSLNQQAGTSRRFILIEQGRPERGDPYAVSLTSDRLRRVVEGTWRSGKQDPLGGGFTFGRLDRRVDSEALLQMERDEMVDTVIASHFDSNRRRGSNLIRLNGRTKYRYLVAKNTDDEGFFLVWDGSDKNTDITMAVYEACVDEAEREGLKPRYHVYARLCVYQTADLIFYQIPDRILADFGLGINEPFNEADT